MNSCLLLLATVYRLALPGYHYEFPRDHFSHPEFQTEWWYYTGNLRATDGHRFGFELTFFRQAVSREEQKDSPWKLDDIYLAHLTLSDVTGQHFYHALRLNRSGPGFAGVDPAHARLWNGNWESVWQLPPPNGLTTRQSLSAASDSFGIDLVMESRKPPVIHGRDGVSQKAGGTGHASHYVSFTRLKTTGGVELNGRRVSVVGDAWMDHEFFTHQLEDSQAGWDWFSIQLPNDTELMLFRIRRKDGSADPFSAGTVVDAHGRKRHLTREEFSLEPQRTWTSPATKASYPIEWQIRVPSLALALDAKTPLDSQELPSPSPYVPSYWEGSIDLDGTASGKPVHAQGYLEMTGYDRAFPK